MSELTTSPVETIPDIDPDLETEEPAAAHIVKTEPGESAAAKVLEARIYGNAARGPVRARLGSVARPEATAPVRGLQEHLRDVSDVQRRPQQRARRMTAV